MRYTAKIDSTAKALTKLARVYGAQVLPLRGAAVDALLLYRGKYFIIDFKGPKTRKTATQEALVASGWPIVFLSTEAQLRELLGV